MDGDNDYFRFIVIVVIVGNLLLLLKDFLEK